jgi:hypothetical protein
MNTFCLKFLILTLIFSLYGTAATLEQQVEQTRQYIESQHNLRCDMFNNDIKSPHITQCSQDIDTILGNENNVRKMEMSKQDLQKHQETILSSVMAKIFIAYEGPRQKKGVSVYDKRETITDSALLRHFEILRLTEDLSISFSMHVTNDGIFDTDRLRRLIVGDYEHIFTYSGIGKKIFLNWFKTIFYTHNPGFIAKNPQHRADLRRHEDYLLIPGGIPCASDYDEEEDDPDLRQAIALSLQGSGGTVPTSAAREEHTDVAALLALLSPEEIAEQARLFEQHDEEKATQDFLRAEREAQANVHAEHFPIAPPLWHH